MNLSLTVLVPGPMQGQKIAITTAKFQIGRDSTCQLQAEDSLISSHHCALLVRGDKAFVQDLGSATGTFVNDTQIADETELHDKDQLRVGPLRFVVGIEVPQRPKPVAKESREELPRLSLVVQIPGPMQGKEIPITVSRFVIGRDPDSHLQAADPSIAPSHCALEVRAPHVFLQQLGTAGGTFVNDQPIHDEVQLSNGDRLRVGPLLFAVRVEFKKKAKSKPAPEVGTTSAAAGDILKKYLRAKKRAREEEEAESVD